MPKTSAANAVIAAPADRNIGGMRAPDAHARQHASVRQAHASELIEDYVELIADLVDANNEARAIDVARRLGVRQATVSKMLGRLRELGLVQQRPYRALSLTEAGRDMAQRSRARHGVVLDFLRALGVSDEQAQVDAEGIEHHVSKETLALMQRFAQSSA